MFETNQHEVFKKTQQNEKSTFYLSTIKTEVFFQNLLSIEAATHCFHPSSRLFSKYFRNQWKEICANIQGVSEKSVCLSKSAPNHCVMCPKVISSGKKVVKMRQIWTFCVERFAREASG